MIHVLHVDDEREEFEIANYNLTRIMDDIEVDWVGSAENAEAALNNDRYDCVICDFQMPGMDGLELLKKIRQKGSTIPFVFLTGQGNEELVVKALREGADDYYTKKVGFAHYQRLSNSLLKHVSASKEREEKLLAVQALSESEEKFRLITENAFDFVWTMDMNMNITYASSSAERLIGFTDEEMVNKVKVSDLYSPEEYARIQKILFEELEKGTQHEGVVFTINHLRKDGSQFPVEIKGRIIFDHNGQPQTVQGYTRDVTHELEAKKALQQSEKKFKSLVDSLPYGLQDVDLEGRVLYTNSCNAKMHGYTADEMIGMTIYELSVDEEERQRTVEYFQEIIKGQIKPESYFVTGRTADGKPLELEIVWNHLKDDGGNIIGIRSVIYPQSE